MLMSKAPRSIGDLFHMHAGARRPTVLHLDRPFDIAPSAGVRHDAWSLASLVDETSAWLYAAGVRAGDRVAVVKDNHIDIVVLAAATARFGAVPASIAAATRPGALAVMLGRLAPSVVVASASVLARARAADVDIIPPDARLVVLPSAGIELDRVGGYADAIAVDELRGGRVPTVQLRNSSESMMIMHTSGTTGVPKLVVHSGDTLFAATRLERLRLPIVKSRPSDVVGSAISFAHGRAATWLAAQFGHSPAELVVLTDHEPNAVSALLAHHRPTSMEACPNIFQRWERIAVEDAETFSRVRLFITTFDAVHPRTVRTFLNASRRRFPIWVQSWGQSEVGPMTSSIFTRSRVRTRSGSRATTSDMGWSMPGLSRVRVVDQVTGKRRTIGRPGLMMASSKARCIDYLGETDRYEEKADGRWWNTGDVGYRDFLWRMRLIDREVDTIPGMSGIDIESVLLDRLARAEEVIVLGLPDRAPVPVVSMSDGHLSADEWRRAVHDLPEMSPPVVLDWDLLPRTATWKVRRVDLREQVVGDSRVLGTGRWT